MNAIQTLLDRIGRRLVAWGLALRRDAAQSAGPDVSDAPGEAQVPDVDAPYDAKRHWLDRVAHLPPHAWRGVARSRPSRHAPQALPELPWLGTRPAPATERRASSASVSQPASSAAPVREAGPDAAAAASESGERRHDAPHEASGAPPRTRRAEDVARPSAFDPGNARPSAPALPDPADRARRAPARIAMPRPIVFPQQAFFDGLPPREAEARRDADVARDPAFDPRDERASAESSVAPPSIATATPSPAAWPDMPDFDASARRRPSAGPHRDEPAGPWHAAARSAADPFGPADASVGSVVDPRSRQADDPPPLQWPELPDWPPSSAGAPAGPDPSTRHRRRRLELEQLG